MMIPVLSFFFFFAPAVASFAPFLEVHLNNVPSSFGCPSSKCSPLSDFGWRQQKQKQGRQRGWLRLSRHRGQHQQSIRPKKTSVSMNFDYEYIPTRDRYDYDRSSSSSSNKQQLSSTYPPGTPAGLRGEAVRSALRSARCIAWSFCGDSKTTEGTGNGNENGVSLNYGVVRVQGAGCVGFLQNKFTQSFSSSTPNDVSSSSSSLGKSDIGLSSAEYGSFCQAGFLNGKGRLIDSIGIALLQRSSSSTAADDQKAEDTAFLITSPGHSSETLYQRLDPFVFPLDQIKLRDCSTHRKNAKNARSFFSFTLASVQREIVQHVWENQIIPLLRKIYNSKVAWETLSLPDSDQSLVLNGITDQADSSATTTVLIVPSQQLAPAAAFEYTFCFFSEYKKEESSSIQKNLGKIIYAYLVKDDSNPEGPIEIGELEWDTLRVESGQPRYGIEITAGLVEKKKKTSRTDIEKNGEEDSIAKKMVEKMPTPPSPLELRLADLINFDKGCYLGQEGVSSIVKNQRGPPRLLYKVVFDDESNLYEHQTAKENDSSSNKNASATAGVDNLTREPRPGDTLYVLGSNEEITVGEITSVAEPGGSGDPITICLCLARRADSILKQMQDRELQVPTVRDEEKVRAIGVEGFDEDGSRLSGLEVIVGGTFTVGRLQKIPSRRGQRGRLFDEVANVDDFGKQEDGDQGNEYSSYLYENRIADVTKISETVQVDSETDPWEVEKEVEQANSDEPEEDFQKALAEAEKAKAEADIAAQEAKRKAEKLEILRLRAEEAMARRTKKENENTKGEEQAKSQQQKDEDSAAAAEAKRKAEKMELLKQQAQAAMARRKKK